MKTCQNFYNTAINALKFTYNNTKERYQLELFSNGCITYSVLVLRLAKLTKRSKLEIHTTLSPFINFEDYDYTAFDMTLKDERSLSLLPNRVPRYIRIYDNQGETPDRYTIVFSGNYKDKQETMYIFCNSIPKHCAFGVYSYGFSPNYIDKPSYKHLGKKINFKSLPDEVKTCILKDYMDIWNIETE